MMLEALPVSRISLRFMVMMFERGEGTACAPLEMPGGAAEAAPASAEAVESAGRSADDGEKGFDGAGAAAESPGRGVGATSCGLIAGGVASSEGSVSARVTITDSPASGVMRAETDPSD